MRRVLYIAAGVFSLMFSYAYAQTPTCQELNGDQKALALEILSTQHPYDCCDDTILECLNEKPICRLAWRLSENVCRRVADGQDKAKIVRSLSRRARSMVSGDSRAKIDLSGMPLAGSPEAPVTIVEYACARCPYCSKITPRLYEAIVDGRLKGKAKMYFKTFPIRGHPFSKETGLGFMAAVEAGRFWEFLLYSYERFDFFCIRKQPDWAEAAGIDRKIFQRLIADPETRAKLVVSKKEGIVNKVDATPTFFIDGRKYVGDMSPEEMVDVIEEEFERVRGKEYLP